MSQLLYDANTGTTLAFDPTRIFLVDVEDDPDFAERLDAEDPGAQVIAENTSPSLADLIPTQSGREVIEVFPNEIKSGDILVENGQHLRVESNDGPSRLISETTRIASTFGTLYLDDDLTVEIIRAN